MFSLEAVYFILMLSKNAIRKAASRYCPALSPRNELRAGGTALEPYTQCIENEHHIVRISSDKSYSPTESTDKFIVLITRGYI